MTLQRERAALSTCVHGKLLGVLSQDQLETMIAHEAGNHRQRIYTPLVTLGLFVEQAISRDQACQDAVGRGLSQRTALGLTASSLNTGPYCKARQRLPLGLIQSCARAIAAVAETNTVSHWRGRSIKLIDGTTVSMPDTPGNQQTFPQNRQQRAGLGFPLALVGVLSLASGAVLEWAVGACEGVGSGESRQLWGLLDTFSPGDMVIADRAYSSWFLLAALQARGIDFVIREHQRRQNDWAFAKRLGKQDHQLTWAKPQRPKWMDQTTYEQLPDHLMVREVQDRDWCIVTSLDDAAVVSKREVADLYRCRWQIELDFRSIKTVMQMDILRCKSAPIVEKEIAAYLLGYNLIRAAMALSARTHSLRPRQLSFAAARRAVSTHQELLRHYPAMDCATTRLALLRRIAYHKLPHRPDQIEPRAVKQRPKPLPLLTIHRAEDRNLLMRKQENA